MHSSLIEATNDSLDAEKQKVVFRRPPRLLKVFSRSQSRGNIPPVANTAFDIVKLHEVLGYFVAKQLSQPFSLITVADVGALKKQQSQEILMFPLPLLNTLIGWK